MQVDDFLLCTFNSDTETPKTTYVAKIVDIDSVNGYFDCEFVDTMQRMKFQFNLSDTWAGVDVFDGSNYNIDTHYIYSSSLTSPLLNEVAIITFADDKSYLCYIDAMDENTEITMYNYPYYRLSISNEDIITESDWDLYPLGELVFSIGGTVLNDETLEPVELKSEIDSNSDKIITYQELLAKKLDFEQTERWVDNLKFDNGYTIDKIIKNYIDGVLKNSGDISVIIKSLAVDTDGPAIEEFPHGDKYQRDTLDYPYKIDPDYIYEVGKFSPRNFADEVPYIVRRGKLSDGRKVMDVIEKGDFGVIIYNGKVIQVAAMDSKSHEGHPLAEASVCALESIGHNPFPVRGSGIGLIGNIEIIMFPKSTLRKDSNFIYNRSEIKRKVRLIQFERLQQLSNL
ncbi:MAG: hypothetical protein WAT71_12505 [Ignavibacteria bacterium]